MHAKLWILLILVALLAGCGQPAVDLTYPAAAGDLIVQATSSGGFVPEAYRQSYIPEFRLYGDGRVLWAHEQDGRTEVREGRISPDEVTDLLAWIVDQGFFDLDDHYTVDEAPTDHASDCVRVHLTAMQKSVCEYYDGAPEAFDKVFGRLWNGANLPNLQPYQPESGWVMAQRIDWDYSGEAAPWPEEVAPAPSQIGQGRWVEGPALALLWQNRMEQGPRMVFEEQSAKYGLVLQVPGLMPEAPSKSD
jgi:hypothetical protein